MAAFRTGGHLLSVPNPGPAVRPRQSGQNSDTSEATNGNYSSLLISRYFSWRPRCRPAVRCVRATVHLCIPRLHLFTTQHNFVFSRTCTISSAVISLLGNHTKSIPTHSITPCIFSSQHANSKLHKTELEGNSGNRSNKNRAFTLQLMFSKKH